MRSRILIISLILLIACLSISGCTSSSGQGSLGLGSIGAMSDNDLYQKGVDEYEQKCINNQPREASTSQCMLSSSDKEKAISTASSLANEMQQECLRDLPRSEDASVCSFSSDMKVRLASSVGGCIVTSGFNNCIGFIQVGYSTDLIRQRERPIRI